MAKLVIDANVLIYATQDNCSTTNCLNVLIALKNSAHLCVIPHKTIRECLTNLGKSTEFCLQWIDFLSARGRLVCNDRAPRALTNAQFTKCNVNDTNKSQMLKDLFLISEASIYDKKIVSCDRTARKLFIKYFCNQLADFHWACAQEHADAIVVWIGTGCNKEAKFSMGCPSPKPIPPKKSKGKSLRSKRS